MRRHRPRVSRFAAGVIGALVIGTACYFVFGGSLPFSGAPFQLKAVFTSQTQADLYVNLDTTFRAIAPVAVPFLQD